MQTLVNLLSEYKQCTLELIENLEKEQYEVLEEILDKRQNLINDMEKMDYIQEEFQSIVNEFNILTIQQKLSKLMTEKRNKAKLELGKFSQTKSANKSYNNRFYQKASIFNKSM